MSSQRDDLQEMWREDKKASGNASGTADGPPRDMAKGKTEVDRLRRSVRRDGWLKIGALLFLLAALPLFAGRSGAAFYGVLVFSLLAVTLGIVQVVCSRGWSETNSALPLAQALAAELEL
ncbi:MAG: hypothetical protein E4H18_02880, partial [Hyphomicrobiales bacterium]